MSRLALGLAALGRPAYITTGRAGDLGPDRTIDELQTRTATVLDAAYRAGIRYLDCARSYGFAERFLAHWLASRGDLTGLTIASKWGYRYVGDWRRDVDTHEVKDHSVGAFTTQLAQTRAELGSRLDVYQIHSLTPDSPALHDAELHARLAELRDRGVRVGFSTSGPGQAAVIRAAVPLEVGGQRLFSVVQSTWNLLEPSAGPALADAAAAGLSVVVKEALANGRLAPGPEDPAPAAADAVRVATELGVPLDQLAIGVALHQPWATWVLSGAVTPAQLDSNVAASTLTLPAELVERLLARPEEPADYWQQRSARVWA